MAHNLTESSTFTANVQVPDDGDFVNEASIEPGLQALANRTKYLNDQVTSLAASKVSGPASATDNHVVRFDGTTGKLAQDGSPVAISDAGAVTGVTSLAMSGALSGVTALSLSGATTGGTTISTSGTITAGDDLVATDDVIAGDAFLYASPQTRVHRISVMSVVPGGSVGWTITANAVPHIQATTTGTTSTVLYSLNEEIPAIAEITRIRVLVDPNSSGSAMAFTARRLSVSGTTVSLAFASGPHSQSASGAVQWIDSGAISLLGGAGTFRELSINGGGEAGSIVLGLEVTYTDNGPANQA